MKNILITSFIFLVAQLQAQPSFNTLNDFEIGKCYSSYPADSNNLDTFYIEIIPPVFETYKQRLSEINITEFSAVDFKELRIEIQPETKIYVERKVSKSCFHPTTPFDKVFVFCVVEMSARYETIESICIEEDGKKILMPSKKNDYIERKRVLQNTQIRVINKEAAIHSTNKTYKIEGGQWDDWKEFLCTSHSRNFSISKLQRAIVEQGYDIEIDGVLGATTRAALIDFQKKNNLPVGRLDIETLKKLGVRF